MCLWTLFFELLVVDVYFGHLWKVSHGGKEVSSPYDPETRPVSVTLGIMFDVDVFTFTLYLFFTTF